MATDIIVAERTRKYLWPEAQLNLWLIIMLISAGLTLGVFANFMYIQTAMNLGSPWLFPYEVVISALAIAFLILLLILIAQRQLLPGVVMFGSFLLFVLWLTGCIQTAIILFGPSDVNANCNAYITGHQPSGANVNTLAWLQQNNICNTWDAAFAFEVVGTVFLFWMMIIAWNVNRDS